MNTSKTAELLVELRKNRNITQITLAEELGISFQAVSKWERGENLPDSGLLVNLAEFYGITVDEILKGKLIEKEDSKRVLKRKRTIFIIAVALIILSPISIFIYGVENYESYLIVILLVVALSTAMIIYASLSTEQMKSFSKMDKAERRKEEIIYTTCAAIYLLLGLGWNLWYIAWIVFIFGYVATLIVKKQ